LATNPTLHFTLDLGPELTTHATTMLTVSPDGTRIVFVADNASGKQSLATRALNHVSITPMPGTEGAGNPFFSPDGQWIGFSSEGKLKKISIHGGAATTIYDGGDFAGGSWGEDNQIIASLLRNPGGLCRVDAAGGTPQLITKASDHHAVGLAFPQILPGGAAIIYSATETPRSFDNARIEVMSLKTGKWKTLQQQAFFGRYLPTGHLVWVRNRTLFGAPFDPLRLEIKGPPVALIEDELATSPEFGSGQFDFSLNGLFVYLAGRLDQHRVLWLDAKGNEEPLIGDPGHYRDATLAPDGKHLVLTTGGGNRVIHIFDMERRVLSRLSSFKEGAIRYPVWSSDSRHIAFIANDKGRGAIWWMRTDGMGEPYLLYDSESPLNRFYFSADNKTIVIEASTEIWIANLDLNEPDRPRMGKREFLLRHLNSGFSVAFSPDGRWMAYTLAQKEETGLFVRPADWHKAGKWQVTTQADKYPAWSRSSREILYQAPNNYICAVDYAVDGEAFVPGKPRLWLDRKFDIGSRFFDLAADGKHVVGIAPAPRNTNLQATFKVNFFEEVRRRTAAFTRP
jgi:serine/threonine-protein kinase